MSRLESLPLRRGGCQPESLPYLNFPPPPPPPPPLPKPTLTLPLFPSTTTSQLTPLHTSHHLLPLQPPSLHFHPLILLLPPPSLATHTSLSPLYPPNFLFITPSTPLPSLFYHLYPLSTTTTTTQTHSSPPAPTSLHPLFPFTPPYSLHLIPHTSPHTITSLHIPTLLPHPHTLITSYPFTHHPTLPHLTLHPQLSPPPPNPSPPHTPLGPHQIQNVHTVPTGGEPGWTNDASPGRPSTASGAAQPRSCGRRDHRSLRPHAATARYPRGDSGIRRAVLQMR